MALAFLLLVVLGALAAFLGLAVGVGVWQAGRFQAAVAPAAPAGEAPPSPAATAPATTAPAAAVAPADSVAGRPSGDAPAGRAAAGPAAGARRDNAPADWPPPDPAAGLAGRRPPAPDGPPGNAGPGGDVWVARPPGMAFVVPGGPRPDGARLVVPAPGQLAVPMPGRGRPEPDPDAKPLVLDAGSAEIRGDGGLRAAGDPKTLTDWKSDSDSANWSVDVPANGVYIVELEYACDPGESNGGSFWLQFRQDAANVHVQSRVTVVVRPTNGWDDYRQQVVGQTYLPAGKTEVQLRQLRVRTDGRLMNLRAVRLRPAKAGRPDGRDGAAGGAAGGAAVDGQGVDPGLERLRELQREMQRENQRAIERVREQADEQLRAAVRAREKAIAEARAREQADRPPERQGPQP